MSRPDAASNLRGARTRKPTHRAAAALAFVLAASLPVVPAPISAAAVTDETNLAVTPTRVEGRRWRIAYYEGGPYINYLRSLRGLLDGLVGLGWLEPMTLPPMAGDESAPLWAWLTRHARSDYLEFVTDAHYSARWDGAQREQVATDLLERLTEQRDIDLVIAAGTWAGLDLARGAHATPTVVISSSNALSSGIVSARDYSGLAHLHARIDPDRHERGVRIFHQIIGFKSLGVAFENTPEGRVYAARDAIDEVAAHRGFDVVDCHTQGDVADRAAAERSVLKCVELLTQHTDALYISEQRGVTPSSIRELVQIANARGVATFSQAGSAEVRRGVLLGLSSVDRADVGRFYSEVIAKIFNGARPGELHQVFEDQPRFAINLETAGQVDFDPPAALLGATDEIYPSIWIGD